MRALDTRRGPATLPGSPGGTIAAPIEPKGPQMRFKGSRWEPKPGPRLLREAQGGPNGSHGRAKAAEPEKSSLARPMPRISPGPGAGPVPAGPGSGPAQGPLGPDLGFEIDSSRVPPDAGPNWFKLGLARHRIGVGPRAKCLVSPVF